jgi:hypothetical protein
MIVDINVPDDLYQEAARIAQAKHVSIDEVLLSTFADHVRAWERLQQRAARGSREHFIAVLDKVVSSTDARTNNPALLPLVRRDRRRSSRPDAGIRTRP